MLKAIDHSSSVSKKLLILTMISVQAGYTIPKGWKVFASFRAVHLDQDHFKEARTFNPWRWQVLLSLSLYANSRFDLEKSIYG